MNKHVLTSKSFDAKLVKLAKKRPQIFSLLFSALFLLSDEHEAKSLRIQYGGSASAANISALMSQQEIDGALVGGASLKADEFVSMVEQSARAKGLG